MERAARLLEVRGGEVEESAKRLAELARRAAEEARRGGFKAVELLEALHDHLHALSHLVEACAEALRSEER